MDRSSPRQGYGTNRIYTLPADTAPGTYVVQVDVTTSVPNADQVPPVSATKTFIVAPSLQAATSVTLTPLAPTTTYGTGVTFTAAAAGGAVGQVYSYRFTLDGAVGAWSTNATYLTPALALGGTHNVIVEATTAPAPAPATLGQVSANTTYTVNYPVATGVSFSRSSRRARSPSTPP